MARANGAASNQPGATPQATERQPHPRAEGLCHNLRLTVPIMPVPPSRYFIAVEPQP